MAGCFEELFREWVSRVCPGFVSDRVGSWWTRDEEIDVVAFDERHALFGECKWSNRPMQTKDLDRLKERARLVPELQGHRHSFALFSRSGFGPIRAPALRVGLDDLVLRRIPPGWSPPGSRSN
ncbi:MAG: DUF234 domain-containing protein [Candidatus Eremiobacterota bacterium]